MKRHVVRTLSPFAGLAWSLLVACHGSMGAESRASERPEVKADEVIEDDLYIFGDEITIDGEVKGDVVAFGRFVRLNGSVAGDFIAAAQAIDISGEVGDDVRFAGQILRIDDGAAITDDVVAAGFSLEIADESSVGGDLLYAGYQALLAGDIGGNVAAGMANGEVSGSIGGDVDLNVGGDEAGSQAYNFGPSPPVSFPNVPPGLTIRDTARIGGELKYESHDELDIEAEVVTGEIEHKVPHVETTRPPTMAERALSGLSRYAALLIVGLCVVLVAPKWTRRMSNNITTRPLASLGLGVVGSIAAVILLLLIPLIMIFFAALAGFVKLTGLVPVFIVLGLCGCAMIVVALWFFTCYLAEIVVSYLVGSWLFGLAEPTSTTNRFLSLFVGLVLLAVISTVPYLGPIVSWLVVLFGIGALIRWIFWERPTESQLVGEL